MECIVLTLEGRVLADQREALEDFLREARPYYESIGDVTMRFMWDARDPLRFREIFEYHTEAAYLLDDHRVNHDPVMQGWLRRWRTMLEGEITVTVWRELGLRT